MMYRPFVGALVGNLVVGALVVGAVVVGAQPFLVASHADPAPQSPALSAQTVAASSPLAAQQHKGL